MIQTKVGDRREKSIREEIHMTVREFMEVWSDNVSVKVYQTPIKEIDKCNELVHRQTGSVDVLLDSNQNYLYFNLDYALENDGLIVVVCTANKEQEQSIIDAHKGIKRR